MKKVLFIDRDGTLIKEAPPTYQIDSWEKLEFYPFAFKYMNRIAEELVYELVMVSNQDELGTNSFPEDQFMPIHEHIITSFKNEGVEFAAVHIDRSKPDDYLSTRKPGIGMLLQYFNETAYDIKNSFVIGDRITDVQLAKNLGCKAIWLKTNETLGAEEITSKAQELNEVIALSTTEWKKIYEYLVKEQRRTKHTRKTNETHIEIEMNLNGSGDAEIKTGLGFFNHMLDQVTRHGKMDLKVIANGDLHIDEHHTIEDTGIALGEAFIKALGDKRGIERYGFSLPMDDAEAKVLIDFGGRSWIVWNVEFKREKIGDMPTEMFFHFFKSFSDAAKCNLHISCSGENEHHKIEAIFKAFAKAIKMAVKKDPFSNYLPSTKGSL